MSTSDDAGQMCTLNRSVSPLLFHFTGVDKARGHFKPDEEAFETLVSILSSRTLRLSPNEVSVPLPKVLARFTPIAIDRVSATVHMACLTETPLEFLAPHMRRYGRFGIGLPIQWGIALGGHNVLYCDVSLPNSYAITVGKIADLFVGQSNHPEIDRAFRMELMGWVGELLAAVEDAGHREEREWRIVRAPRIDGGRAAPFDHSDVEVVLCPRRFVGALRETLARGGYVTEPRLVAAEAVLEEEAR